MTLVDSPVQKNDESIGIKKIIQNAGFFQKWGIKAQNLLFSRSWWETNPTLPP
jgi:hypothetical protein